MWNESQWNLNDFTNKNVQILWFNHRHVRTYRIILRRNVTFCKQSEIMTFCGMKGAFVTSLLWSKRMRWSKFQFCSVNFQFIFWISLKIQRFKMKIINRHKLVPLISENQHFLIFKRMFRSVCRLANISGEYRRTFEANELNVITVSVRFP